MTNLPPEPPNDPEFSDDAIRDDVPNDPLSDPRLGREDEQLEHSFYGEETASGVQHTLSISDGNTFVTDEDFEENTSVNVSDPDLAREVRRAGPFDPDQGVPTEEEVLNAPALPRDEGEGGGLDPVPVR